MQDVLTMLNSLTRPRLLISAARIGVADYRRNIHLPRLLHKARPPASGATLLALMDMEAELNGQRKRREACYCVSRHVEVLTAMMGEARILRATTIS